MKILVEELLTEKDWYDVSYVDSSGKNQVVSFYAVDDDDAKELFRNAVNGNIVGGQYYSETKKQKFEPSLARRLIHSGYQPLGATKSAGLPPMNQIVSLEDRVLRSKAKEYADANLGTPPDALLHHKDGYEGNNDYVNLVAVDTKDTWLRSVIHNFIHRTNFNTTDLSSKSGVSRLPLVITVPVEEYDASGRVVLRTFKMEIN